MELWIGKLTHGSVLFPEQPAPLAGRPIAILAIEQLSTSETVNNTTPLFFFWTTSYLINVSPWARLRHNRN